MDWRRCRRRCAGRNDWAADKSERHQSSPCPAASHTVAVFSGLSHFKIIIPLMSIGVNTLGIVVMCNSIRVEHRSTQLTSGRPQRSAFHLSVHLRNREPLSVGLMEYFQARVCDSNRRCRQRHISFCQIPYVTRSSHYNRGHEVTFWLHLKNTKTAVSFSFNKSKSSGKNECYGRS